MQSFFCLNPFFSLLFRSQIRPDRNNFVAIDFNNIPEKNKHNFQIANTSTVLGSDYEYGSVMHYVRSAFAINTAIPTITPKQAGATLGNNVGATDLDIIKVRLLYQCFSGARNRQDYDTNLCSPDW